MNQGSTAMAFSILHLPKVMHLNGSASPSCPAKPTCFNAILESVLRFKTMPCWLTKAGLVCVQELFPGIWPWCRKFLWRIPWFNGMASFWWVWGHDLLLNSVNRSRARIGETWYKSYAIQYSIICDYTFKHVRVHVDIHKYVGDCLFHVLVEQKFSEVVQPETGKVCYLALNR